MSAELFNEMPFNLRGEELREEIDQEGELRLDAENKANERKAQTVFPICEDKRHYYRTAWTLVGGYSFTSKQCVSVRYIGLGQFRINETPETLHECHLRDFCL